MASVILEYCYSFITLFLLWFFLRKSLKEQSFKKNSSLYQYKNWFFFGSIFGAYSFSWLYTVYPLAWVNPGILQLVGIGIIHSILIVLCGVAYSIVGCAFIKKHTPHVTLFLFSSLLVLAEVVRSIIFSTLFMGNGGTVGLHWTAGTVGNALSSTPFIEYAYFGGTYILTCIVGILVYSCASNALFKKMYLYGVGITILLIGIHIYVPVHTPKEEVFVSVITTDFPTPKKDSNWNKVFAQQFIELYRLTNSIPMYTSDILVYPEGANYTKFFIQNIKEEMSTRFGSALFIDGDTTVKDTKLVNTTLFYQADIGPLATREKVFIFPFNEYLPKVFEKIFRLFVRGEYLDAYVRDHTFTPGEVEDLYLYKGIRIGTIICSEILSFGTLSKLHKQYPDIVFYQSRLGVFHKSVLFEAHLRSFSKVAAAQLRTPFISSNNEAVSYILSPYGKILYTIPISTSVHTYKVHGNQIIESK
jgi:apolipoprotein N-acyltransferase